MNRSEFESGLDQFAQRHAKVNQQLHDIEQQGLLKNQVDRYRRLLDELISIANERAQFCKDTHKESQMTAAMEWEA